MKKISLVIITVFLTFLLASCDVSQQLEEFSDELLNNMADNLYGIFKDADGIIDDSSDESDSEDISSDVEGSDILQENSDAEES